MREKPINRKSYLTYGPRIILIFTGIKSIEDYDYLHLSIYIWLFTFVITESDHKKVYQE
jgi:hypothetical protein